MARYIELDKLVKEFSESKNKPFTDWVDTGLLIVLNYVGGEDVKPVVHAHKIKQPNGHFDCSNCGKNASYNARYCWYCGAKMDEEAEHD